MAIYGRCGTRCTVVRLATSADVKPFEGRKPDAEDERRSEEGWRAICRWEEPDKHERSEFLADAAYLRADGGWREISEAFRAFPDHPDHGL